MPPINPFIGEFIPLPFRAADFVGVGTVTWTVEEADVGAYGVFLFGNLCTAVVQLTSTTTGGIADTTLRVNLPLVRTGLIGELQLLSTFAMVAPVIVQPHALTREAGTAVLTAAQARIDFERAAGGTWPVGANDTDIFATVSFPIRS